LTELEELLKVFEGKTDEQIDASIKALKKERQDQERKKKEQQLRELFSSQITNLKKKFSQPQIADAFKREIDRAAKDGVGWMSRSGNLLPTILPAIGSLNKNYPISGLLKAVGIIPPQGLAIVDNRCYPQRGYSDEPYVLFGINAFVVSDLSPQEASLNLRDDQHRWSPFALDDTLAIFYQGIELDKRPHSILILGSLWGKRSVVIKVDQEGKKTLARVPWKEKIPGKIFIPVSVGGCTLLYW